MTASNLEKMSASSNTSPNQAKPIDAASPDKVNGASPSKIESGDQHKTAMNHFVAGKRHLLVKDLDAANTSLALACELLSAEFGETAYECADAYYYYGKVLLEMARAEQGVFGNALDGVPDGEDSDNSQVEDPDKMTDAEREDVEKKVGEALDENFTVLEEKLEKREELKNGDSTEEETEGEGEGEESEGKEGEEKEVAETKEDAEKEKEEVKEGEKEEEKVEKEEEVGGTEAAEKEGEDKKEQEVEEEEDPSNLQLAWEMLELAKVAYTIKLEAAKDDEKKMIEPKICETLLRLAEVSLESENYEQAVADITDCLAKRKVLHAGDSRRIAETNYYLGVALGHFNKFDEAVTALEDAIKILQLRMENLKKKTESESRADDAFYSRESEITELESLIPEIREKIQYTKDMKDQAENGKEEVGFGASSAATASPKPISAISVKRKADGGDSVSPKKSKN